MRRRTTRTSSQTGGVAPRSRGSCSRATRSSSATWAVRTCMQVGIPSRRPGSCTARSAVCSTCPITSSSIRATTEAPCAGEACPGTPSRASASSVATTGRSHSATRRALPTLCWSSCRRRRPIRPRSSPPTVEARRRRPRERRNRSARTAGERRPVLSARRPQRVRRRDGRAGAERPPARGRARFRPPVEGRDSLLRRRLRDREGAREPGAHVAGERRATGRAGSGSLRAAFAAATLREPMLRACSQAGLVNNLNDALAWGLVPLYLAAHGASATEIGLVAGVYPAVWGAGQLLTGWLSDHVGRKPLITAGMFVQAGALALLVAGGGAFASALVAAVLLGVGTALVYPTLIAAVSDGVQPVERAPAVGVYRFWRDLGFVVGALLAGLVADAAGAGAAIAIVAALTAGSGLWVALTRWIERDRSTDRRVGRRDVEDLLAEARS